MNKKIKGLVAAPASPLHSDYSVNTGIIEEYYEFLVRNGVSGAFICGSTGESVLLSVEERMKLANKWMEIVKTDYPVLIHVGTTNNEETKKLAAHAQDIGASGISTMVPFLFKPFDVEGLVKQNALEASYAPDVPYYLYYIPGLTGKTFNMMEYTKLASEEIPNFAGIKYSNTYFEELSLLIRTYPQYTFFHGSDQTLLYALMCGADVAIGSTYNYTSPLFNELIDNYNNKNMDKCKELNYKIQDMIYYMHHLSGHRLCTKNILRYIGLDLGPAKPPLDNMSAEEETLLKTKFEELGFFDYCSK